MSAAVARPYAAAAFAYARGQGAVAAWESALDNLAAAAGAVFAASRKLVSDRALAAALGDVVALDAAQWRFLTTVAENGRVAALPHIAERFRALRLDDEGVVPVRVESAQPISDRAAFDQFLARWVGARVQSTYVENPALIGGARVYARDDVLDASVLGRLKNLASSLKNDLN